MKNFKQHFIIQHNKTSNEASCVAGKAGINLERVREDDIQSVAKKETEIEAMEIEETHISSILSDEGSLNVSNHKTENKFEMQPKSRNKVLIIENIVIQEPNASESK